MSSISALRMSGRESVPVSDMTSTLCCTSFGSYSASINNFTCSLLYDAALWASRPQRRDLAERELFSNGCTKHCYYILLESLLLSLSNVLKEQIIFALPELMKDGQSSLATHVIDSVTLEIRERQLKNNA